MAAKRRIATLSAVLALTTACSGAVDDGAPSRDARQPVRVDESIGVLRVPAGEPLRIALLLDVTGDGDGLAGILEAAARTALEDFGPIQQGFRATIEPTIDTECDRTTASRIGSELATDRQLGAVLGPQCSQSLLGVQGPLSDAGLVVVAARPDDVTLTASPDGLAGQDRAPGMWRTSPTLLDEARTAATFAFEELEARRAATFHDGGIESAALVTAFKTHFESLGGTVIVARTIDASIGTDGGAAAEAALDEALDAVVDARPDVAFLPLAPNQLLALADEWGGRTALRNVARLTTSRAATEAFLGDPASEGHLLVAPVLTFLEATSAVTGMSSGQVRERVAALSATPAPVGWWAYAYDATTLLLRALEDASIVDADGSLVVSRSELRATLSRLAFRGLTGDIVCVELGDCGPRRFEVRSHDDASIVTLADLKLLWSTTATG